MATKPQTKPQNDVVLNEICINDVPYVRKDSISAAQAPSPNGNRRVVVVDRGWMFAGDYDYDKETNEVVLTRASWIFKWESIGFDGMVANPTSTKVQIRHMKETVRVPKAAVLFTVNVDDNWADWK